MCASDDFVYDVVRVMYCHPRRRFMPTVRMLLSHCGWSTLESLRGEPLDRLQQTLIDVHARAVQTNKRILTLFSRAVLTIHGDNPDVFLPDIRRRGDRARVRKYTSRAMGPINPTVVALLVHRRMMVPQKEIVSVLGRLFDHTGIVDMETFCATDMVVAWKEFGQTLVCTPRQYTAVAKAIAKLLMFGSYEVLMVRYRFRGRITGGSVPLATSNTTLCTESGRNAV